MQAHVDDTHRKLGELAVMAKQTESAERQILERATARLDEVQAEIEKAGPEAMTGGGDKYMELVAERGHLHQVIAQARQHLTATPA